jgi:autotransporter-associated beta strand protein
MKNMFNFRFTKTAILTAIACFVLGESALAQSTVKWTGADIPNGNLNWSDSANWSGGTPPGNIVIFPGGPFPVTTNTIGAVNNIVDQSTTIAGLIYNNTNSALFPYFNTTFINPGVTLMSTGSIPLVVDGYAGGTEWDTTVNISGTNYALVVSNYTGTVWIGGTNAQNVESATFILGDGTNIIDCGTFNLGNSAGGNGRQTTLRLGNGPTTLSANTMNIGVSKAMGTIQFNTNVVGGSLTMYGTNGPTSRVATMTLGSATSGSGSSVGLIAMTNTQPFSALVSTLVLGQLGNDTTTSAHGIVNFNNGTMDVTTVEMGLVPIGGTIPPAGKTAGNLLFVGGSAVTTATLIVNSPSGPGGGSFIIGDAITNNGAAETSALTISSNGTVQAYCSIVKAQAGFNTNAINLGTNGSGTLLLENDGNTVGTAAAPIDVINIDGTLGLIVDGTATTPSVFGTTVTASGGTILIESVTNLAILKSIPLISYNSANGTPISGLTLAPLPTGYVGNLVDDGAGTISISIRPSSFVLVQLLWAGTVGSHTWDIGTSANWTNLNGSGFSIYTNPDEVAFDDTAANPNVTLNTNVQPGTLSFSNSSQNYVISGTGSIGGGALNLLKTGSGSLRLSESGGDSFGGGISVNGGTLILDDLNGSIDGGLSIANGTVAQIGNSDVSGRLPTGPVTDNGSLVFNHSSGGTDIVARAISGSGTVTLSGSGTVDFTVSNTYSGNTVVNAGVLALSGSGTVSSSANVAINNGTLDTSGESASSLPITLPNNSTISSSTLTLAMPNQTPALFANEFSMSGTVTVNVTGLPPIASYPTTLTLAQTLFGINGTFSLVRGSLPAGFSGTVGQSSGNILLTLTGGPIGVRPTTVWNGTNGVSANINWSTANNWILPGAPTPADNVIFVGNGTAVSGSPYSTPGNGPGGIANSAEISSTVDSSFTIGTLTYTNLNLFHNTMIANGDSLNVVSNGSLTVGSPTVDFGGGNAMYTTIGGANATLNVNNTNGTVFVGVGAAASGGQYAMLDLSGLGTFNATVGRVLVGAGSTSEGVPVARVSGILYLAQTNDIIASLPVSGTETSDTATNAVSFDIGDDNGNASSQTAMLLLGQTNAIFADAIGVGRQKQAGTMGFNAFFTGNNTAYFRGANTNAVGVWSIGDGVANGSGITANGACDFTATSNDGNGDGSGGEGYVNALVTTMYVGRGSSSTGSSGEAMGVLTFDNGVINVGTLFLGNQPAAAVKAAVGTVNVNTNNTLGVSATLTAGTLNLGTTVTGGAGGAGIVNIGGGTVMVGTMVCGGTNTSITLGANSLGGTLVITNPVAGPGIGTLALQGGTLQLSPVYGLTNVVASNVTITAATKVNIAALGTTVGGPIQVTLISYTGTDPGIGNLSVGTIPTGFSAPSLTDDAAGHIFLNITAPPILGWVGAVGSILNSSWDIGITHNWAAGSTYANNDLVLFADTASNGVVNLTTSLLPDSTSVSNNVLNYTFTGSGNITGNAFVKQGTASLVIDNSTGNNFSSVNIAGGTVQLGNNDANGSLGSTPITDNGSLAFKQNVNGTFANTVSGSGSLVQIGNNVLTLSAANSAFTGTVLITNGVLIVTGTSALGASTATMVVTNGGTFDDNAIAFNGGVQQAMFVSGAGYNGQGAIVNNGAAQTAAFSNITVTANVTLGGSNRWDIRAKTGTDASLNMYPSGTPYSITKVGTNQVSLVNVGTVDANLGNIYIQNGEFAVQEGTTQLGNSASNIVVSVGANLELFGLTTPVNKVITLNGNGTSDSLKVDSGGGADNTVTGPVTLNGPCVVDITASTAVSTIQGVISGSGSLTQIGSGTLILSNADIYTGSTTISGGNLVLGSTGSIANSPAITIAGGATFNVSAVSGFALGGSQTLSNSTSTAKINGSVSTGSGTLALTYSSGTPSLLVTNGTFTLSSGTSVTVNNTGAQLAPGTYALINAATGASIAGTAPSAVTVTGSGAAGNASLAVSAGSLNLVISAGPPPQLHFTSISISGHTLTFSAANGTANGPFRLLSSTNLLTPVAQWIPVFTNSFDSNGSVNLSTNVVVPGIPQEYYLIVEP